MDEDDIRLYRDRRPAIVAVLFLAAVAAVLAYGILQAFTPPDARVAPQVIPGEPEVNPGEVEFEVIERRIDTALPETVGENERLVASQTVVVRVADEGGHDRFGTGFLYRENVIVSAAHIIGDETGGELRVYCDGIESPGTILAIDDIRDVVVISAPDCPAFPLSISADTLGAKDELHAVGFTFGDSYDIAHRYHRRVHPIPAARFDTGGRADPETERRLREMRERRLPHLVGIDALCIPGNSGSPVYRGDAIVGMIVIRDAPNSISFIVPAVTLRHVLNDAGIR